MPKPNARRRDFILEEAAVPSLFQRLLDFLHRYRKWMCIGMAAAITAAVGLSLHSHLKERRSREAAVALAQLRPKLSLPESAAETVAALENLSKTYAGTNAALEADLARAHLLYQSGKFAEALKAYQDLAARQKIQQDPGLRFLVLESLSYCQEALGKWDEAAATVKPLWEQAEGVWRGELLRRYAMLAEKAGQLDEARRAWENLLERPPIPLLVPWLKEKLAGAAPQASPGATPAKP